jgi:hypothetical protein
MKETERVRRVEGRRSFREDAEGLFFSRSLLCLVGSLHLVGKPRGVFQRHAAPISILIIFAPTLTFTF